jgi:hypothetical protein
LRSIDLLAAVPKNPTRRLLPGTHDHTFLPLPPKGTTIHGRRQTLSALKKKKHTPLSSFESAKPLPIMSTRQTRRQAAAAAAAPADEDEQKTLLNGNGAAHAATEDSSVKTPQENIFLFWPNIIGALLSPSHTHPSRARRPTPPLPLR